MTVTQGKGRGFRSMTPERRRSVSAKGGKSANQQGRAHKWTPEEASMAGRKGGFMRAQRIRERKATQS